MKMQVASATLPKLGETANGDLPFHRLEETGRNLLAVIDGLGHGQRRRTLHWLLCAS